jgi:hypothetical protein
MQATNPKNPRNAQNKRILLLRVEAIRALVGITNAEI